MSDTIKCASCGRSGPAGDWCVHCGANPTARDPEAEAKEAALFAELYGGPAPAAASSGTYAGSTGYLRPEFTGTAGEYFRIWIVNTLLSIITFGIYSPWAKVRTRQYFYGNTILDGQPFEYTAKPTAILKGYLLIGVGFIAYNMFQTINPIVSLVLLALFYVFLPFLLYKSMRFFAHNTVYRNIRMRFTGTLKESYKVYMLLTVLIPFTMGLIIPYWMFRKRQYFFDNMAYGSAVNEFTGRAGGFYKVYLTAWLAFMGAAFVGGLMMAIIVPAALSATGTPGAGAFVGLGLFYLVFLALSIYVQMYIYAWENNYCFGISTLGGLSFESTLDAGRLFWIRLTNILAIIFSFGLLTAWAKVRRMRYIVENIAVMAPEGLDIFASSSAPDESAYGEAATDFFDFEIGL